MHVQIVTVGSQFGVLIDAALLEVVGIKPTEGATLTTDGSRLILAPVGGLQPPAGATTRQDVPDFRSPTVTVHLLDELEEHYGLLPRHFSQLHHFGTRSAISVHRDYCRVRESFRPGNNVDVARRLHSCLLSRKAGHSWEESIRVALAAWPLPPTET